MICNIPWKRRVELIILSSVHLMDSPRPHVRHFFLGRVVPNQSPFDQNLRRHFENDGSVDELGGSLPQRLPFGRVM